MTQFRNLRIRRSYWLGIHALALLLALASVVSFVPGAPVRASTAQPFGLPASHRTSPDGVEYFQYSGDVATFDGLPLAAEVFVPASAQYPLPLVVMFHGWGQDKTAWQSETVANSDPVSSDWNNLAFVKRGYAVLTYTARGFHDSCGPADASDRSNSATLPRDCLARKYWIHLADPLWEIRDAQHLIGRLVDDGIADPERIGVTGQSYGGAHAWWLALLNDRTYRVNESGAAELLAWRSPQGTPLRIAAAAPLYTWSSLTAALLPNGRSSAADVATAAALNAPVGVPLESYISGFFALGAKTGFYSPPGIDKTADLTTWYGRIRRGNPFSAEGDPILSEAMHQLDRRSPLYLNPDAPVPIFQVQGFTDALFPAVQAVQMRNHVLRWNSGYPITSIFADVGHSYANADADVWQAIHNVGHRFFAHHLKHEGDALPRYVSALTTTCVDGQQRRTITAPSWNKLSRYMLSFSSSLDRLATTLPPSDGVDADPIAQGSGCIGLPTGNNGAATWNFPVAEPVILVGQPRITLRFTPSAGDVELNVRLWDVAPDGSVKTLVSRGTYRYLGTAGQQAAVSFELSANAWELLPNHDLRLEVLGNDAPYYQASNIPAVIGISDVDLAIPAR